MPNLLGFTEHYGINVAIEDYVSRILSDCARHFRYDQIQIPTIEPATSYSEEVVGESPWPEWNEKGCFYFDVLNYRHSYHEAPEAQRVLLIPEGTVSVTRWLGDQLQQGVRFPLKMFYNLKCFRNELTSTLSVNKCREFSQFGMEVLGSDNPHSDLEILCVAASCLQKLGIQPEEIRIRLNDVTIFNQLIEESGLQRHKVELKELLDTLAEVKAGKGVERKAETLQAIDAIFAAEQLTDSFRDKWNAIIGQAHYELDQVGKILGSNYAAKLDNLRQICQAFRVLGIPMVADLCVIRSHEYYTSLSYEIDVLTGENAYIEIAGGGRYDRLVSSFVPEDYPVRQVPCTGFAFGTARVIHMLKQEHRIPAQAELRSRFYFGEEPFEEIRPAGTTPGDYIRAFIEHEKSDYPVSIWIG